MSPPPFIPHGTFVEWVLFFALFLDEKPKFREVQKLVTGAVIGGTEVQTQAGVRAACLPSHSALPGE